MPTRNEQNKSELQKLVAQILEAESREKVVPERPELEAAWDGRTIHVLRPILLLEGAYGRGATITITAAMVRASVDYEGHSIFDSLADSDAIGEGPWPEDLALWLSDDDPVKEQLYKKELAELKEAGNATQRAYGAVHRKYETEAQRFTRERDEARQATKLGRWGS